MYVRNQKDTWIKSLQLQFIIEWAGFPMGTIYIWTVALM